ncbi:MAG: preprotein translocase subunit SecA [Planctomycetales bacterium 4484_113]|nr:MAG: preprotein translocase subunit SecA [Planctomycetales bacterium 4484_113]
MGFFEVIFDSNKRELRRLEKEVARINEVATQIAGRDDAWCRERIAQIRAEIEPAPYEKQKELMTKHLPEVFAIVRDVSERTVGMRHFDVQMMAGIVLHEGRIAEQKTGEGKTLSATLALSLNALTGRGAHLVTVNDYLAQFHAEWMGPIYRTLGLSVGSLQHDTPVPGRKELYRKDIIYGTNNEFGFDYLRDNMVIHEKDLVQRELYYAIIDEVDSILIDEARTPLIISGSSGEDTSMYYRADEIVRSLRGKDVTGEDKPTDIFEQRKMVDDSHKDWDYEYDRKSNSVSLTSRGIARVEQRLSDVLRGGGLFDFENTEVSHFINQALKAHSLFENETDYIVKEGEVVIVDEFTGRLMFGRRYSDGLHQAIEAKEGLKVKSESQTLATITLQNYFRMYEKLAGMTGTAKTEEEEFKKIYNFDVVVIPTNKPMIRKDYPDAVYKTEKGKFRAIIDEIMECHERGQPVLVGTVSIEKSERLARMLKNRGIPHEVLNAKHHEKEALIIAQAGRVGAVTIATNMAGRGTDIVLGGNPEYLARERMKARGLNWEEDPETYGKFLAEASAECEGGHEKVVAAGGLHIVGSERHESRRIDNQLRGRSGRQGDPGSSRFFLSLEDDLMKMYGGERIAWLMDKVGLGEDERIEHRLLTRAIENAQKKVEGRNFEIRRNVLQYDDVMNKQREVIYAERRKILHGENLREQVMKFLGEMVDALVSSYVLQSARQQYEIDREGILAELGKSVPVGTLTAGSLEGKTTEEIKELLRAHVVSAYEAKESEIGPDVMREIERVITLRTIDENWIDHLNILDHLREGVGLRGYAQVDPVVVYAQEAFELFEALKTRIQSESVAKLLRVQVKQPPVERKSAYNIRGAYQATAPAGGAGGTVRRKRRKIGRNEPCWCGSGKKYKHCHGRPGMEDQDIPA